MGQASQEVVQSIGEFGLKAAEDFLARVPVDHFILTADTSANRTPLAADSTLHPTKQEAEVGLIKLRAIIFGRAITTFADPKRLTAEDRLAIAENLGEIQPVEIDEGGLYVIPADIHRVLEHKHDPADS